ncbi:MAG TPA: hypothetical protein VG796_16295 [Verrucomicrobiales bacterium]|jgi:hypothetical protein|nr:hypothetical protein [Verrucomicrobiales bacterium]
MKLSTALLLPIFAATCQAATTTFNDTITAIYGGGNPNGGWTSVTEGNLEIALRGKNRDTGATTNDGAGTYSFPTGFAVNPARALWQFEYSMNSDADGGAVTNLSSYRFVLSFDTDPSLNQAWSTLDLSLIPDNSFGTSATANGAGAEGLWSALAGSNTVAQNSQNMVFFPGFPSPNANGTYDFKLTAYSSTDTAGTTPLADVGMRVEVGAGGAALPDSGSTLAMLGSAFLGLVGLSKLKSRRNAR